MDQPSCYRLSPTGLSLFVRVTPNAGRDAIEGVEIRDDGSAVLRLRVKAITLTAGDTARQKTLALTGDGPALAAAITALS